MTLPTLNQPKYRIQQTANNRPPFTARDNTPPPTSFGGRSETNRVVVVVGAEYDYMDDDEQDAAFRALSLSRLQVYLHDEPDYDPEV